MKSQRMVLALGQGDENRLMCCRMHHRKQALAIIQDPEQSRQGQAKVWSVPRQGAQALGQWRVFGEKQ
jgi:hypothetical protein